MASVSAVAALVWAWQWPMAYANNVLTLTALTVAKAYQSAILAIFCMLYKQDNV
jgi:NADH:ubiquinone oxidoreductase subunit K